VSLASFRPFLAQRMVGLGFEQWKDAFNVENIPATRLQKAFHLETITGAGVRQNMHAQEVNLDTTIRIWQKGFRNPSDAMDAALVSVDRICLDLLSVPQRIGGPVKNITLGAITLAPINDSNDNIVVASIGLTAYVILATT